MLDTRAIVGSVILQVIFYIVYYFQSIKNQCVKYHFEFSRKNPEFSVFSSRSPTLLNYWINIFVYAENYHFSDMESWSPITHGFTSRPPLSSHSPVLWASFNSTGRTILCGSGTPPTRKLARISHGYGKIILRIYADIHSSFKLTMF